MANTAKLFRIIGGNPSSPYYISMPSIGRVYEVGEQCVRVVPSVPENVVSDVWDSDEDQRLDNIINSIESFRETVVLDKGELEVLRAFVNEKMEDFDDE